MKLAIISSFPPRKCGIGIYLRSLVNSMSKIAETEVISFSGYKYQDKRVKPMIKGALSYFKIAGYLKKKKFDQVMVQYDYVFYNLFIFPLFLLLLKIYRLKTNLVIHTIAPYKDFIKKNIFRLYHTYLFLPIDKVFVFTQSSKNKLLASTLVKKPVEIVPLPIIKRKTKSKAISKGDVKILCFGFIVWDKGIDIAVNALGNAKNISLKIVGSIVPTSMKKQYDFLEKIKALAAKYNNVKLINRFISEEEKTRLYSDNDFVVLPYRLINQSAVLTEVWSFNKIPICSDLDVLKEEISDDKYGILFKNEDIIDLREKTIRLISNKSKQKEIIANIKKLVEKRNFDEIARIYLKLIKK